MNRREVELLVLIANHGGKVDVRKLVKFEDTMGEYFAALLKLMNQDLIFFVEEMDDVEGYRQSVMLTEKLYGGLC